MVTQPQHTCCINSEGRDGRFRHRNQPVRSGRTRALAEIGGPFGPLLEGFVTAELARQITWSDQDVELFHYRTRDKVEVDVILENRRRSAKRKACRR